MWNIARVNGDIIPQTQREGMIVAVAVDKDKSSQHALKWAIDNLSLRDKPIKLIHVNQTSRSPPGSIERLNQQETDAKALEVLLPYRCFCTRRQVQFEVVILNDQDVARALNDYVSLNVVEMLLLGASSKHGLSRIFKNSDVPSVVLKTVPDFCSIYVISKRKVCATRPATRSPPIERTQQNFNDHADHDVSYDELSIAENDNASHVGSGRLSTDSNCVSFYENLGSGLAVDSSILGTEFPSSNTAYSDVLNEVSCYEDSSFSLQNLEYEEDIRKLNIEVKQTRDMYHAARNEALTSKQKMMELQDWKMKQEQRTKKVELATMELVEKEKARCKEAIEAAKRLAQQEVERRVLRAELRAQMEAEEKNKVWDALGKANSVLKYQSSFHILVVMFSFFLYFSLLK
ncbi:hypothetical protein L6164_007414 [Bauhinia variegata]|uniref:Uncharacterized protein n=1 Tax=Bauhinia variegata TaxID=167791 RepID=A0ACB9PEW6_BAUVA|nr:hypothetical protein L6164_007414 [Bauhinia variegata]